MTWAEISQIAASLWVVWLMALFIGMVVWVFWPSRKRRLESYGNIPLDDEDGGS